MNKAASTSIPEQKQRIARLTQNGQHDNALHLAHKLSEKLPGDPDVWFLLAGVHALSGNLDELISCCQQTIRLNPRHAGAFYNMAVALHRTGRLEEADASFRKCLEIGPGNPAALTGLGKVSQDLGDFQSARACFFAVQRIEPGNSQPLINTGLTYHAEGNYAEAHAFYEKALEVDPESAEAHYYTGVAWQLAGYPEKAAEAYRHAINLRQDYREATINLGHILAEQGHLRDAEILLKCFIETHPGSAEAHNNLGVVYESMGRLAEAEQCYRKAIESNPTITDTFCHLAYMLADDGRTDEALEYFDRALMLVPEQETALAGKSSTLEKLGKLDAATRIIEPVITRGSCNPDIVLAWCRLALRTGNLDPGIELARSALEAGNLPAKAISDLNRTLGDLHDRKHAFETAFRHYERSNKSSPCNYDHRRQVEYIDRIIGTITPGLLASLPRASHDTRNIVFIIGMPRSGTSLVEQILSSHPDVYGAGELRIIGDIADSLRSVSKHNQAYPEAIADLDQADVDRLSGIYTSFVDKLDPESVVLTDKMPHNFIYTGLITLILPRAKIIHVKREPMDNCLSLYFQGFNPMHSYVTDLRMLGKYYKQYERLMEHWALSLDTPILDVSYEYIVDDLESGARNLLEFCGLPWSPDCMHFYRNKRFVKTPSYDQVRQPIYKSSVGRWRNYQPFIEPLKESLES